MYEKNPHTNVWQGGELPRLQLSAQQSFFWAVSGDWTANPLVYGRPHSPLCHGRPKHKLKNIWKKHAYKCIKKKYKHGYRCMKKTRIQMCEKKHTNTHTNVWQKHEHKCMTKIYSYTGQPIPAPRGNGVPCSRSPQLWQGGELPAVSPPFLYLSSEWGLNHQPSSYCTTTLTTAPRPTQIQT